MENFSARLNQGETLAFGNKCIKFKEVISDSRCPTGVTCIWAGEAKILVEIFEGEKKLGEKMLTINPVAQGIFDLNIFSEEADFSLQLSHLQPYPNIDKIIDPSDYHLQMAVKKTLKVQ